jgi:hypothetical protein
MDREDIIRMAREAGFDPHDMSDDFTCNLEDIERFAALVAKHEREACAKLCDGQGSGRKALEHYAALTYVGATHDCAAAIRARGTV